MDISSNRWPAHGRLGLGLILVFWWLNWSLTGLRTHLAFFPLWLGYCLTMDAWVFRRKGSSLMTRNSKSFVKLFFFSMPSWWLFELLNLRTQNWRYEGREFFPDFQYFVFASLSFSTVMPAVFETSELVSTFGWLRRFRHGPVIALNRPALVGFFCAGWLMLALLLLWPVYFFPFLWLSVYFILEPLNVRLKNRSFAACMEKGDWRPAISLCLGALLCGFFWELWNYHSYPKWVYRIPFVDFWRVFEMPLLGYGGYLPFALELYALYNMLAWIFRQREMQGYIRLESASD